MTLQERIARELAGIDTGNSVERHYFSNGFSFVADKKGNYRLVQGKDDDTQIIHLSEHDLNALYKMIKLNFIEKGIKRNDQWI